MIFIQIAAYKDPELVPTISDCLSKADFPGDLRFGVCLQSDEGDRSLSAFANDLRFRIDHVPWQKSEGLCLARARLQKLYDGETFTLQLDSHHRFSKGWDSNLLRMIELTESAKPLITSYASVYKPGQSGGLSAEPYKMVAEHFTPSGTILFRPQSIKDWRALSKPFRARFVSGHFFYYWRPLQ